jgi:hypothetical protein
LPPYLILTFKGLEGVLGVIIGIMAEILEGGFFWFYNQKERRGWCWERRK